MRATTGRTQPPCASGGSIIGIKLKHAAIRSELGIEFLAACKTAFDFDTPIALEFDFLQLGISGPSLILKHSRRHQPTNVCGRKERIAACFDIINFVPAIEIDLDTRTAR